MRFSARCACVLVLLLFAPAASEAQRLPIRTYTIADGLPSDHIMRIVRDPKGFLWICSGMGLSRFDGERITTYDHEGLPFSTINDLLITRGGEYWLASNGSGVIRFDVSAERPTDDAGATDFVPRSGHAWRFRLYRVNAEAAANRVNVLFEDRRGRIWAGTDGGLFVASSSNGPPDFARMPILGEAGDWSLQVWDVIETADESLWIGSTAGLFRRLPDGRLIAYRWSSPDAASGSGGSADTRARNVWAFALDGVERLWIGHEGGLTAIVPEQAAELGTERSMVTLPSADLSATDDHVVLPDTSGDARTWSSVQVDVPTPVRALTIAQDGHVWMSGPTQLTEFDGERFSPYLMPMQLTVGDVAGVVDDADGHIWTSTVANGAVRLARSGFTIFPDGAGQLFETRDGTRCAHTPSALRCFDGRRFAAVEQTAASTGSPVAGAWFVLHDRTASWWVATKRGLYRFPPGVRVTDLDRTRPQRIYTARDGLVDDEIFRLFEDSRGDIWIGTFHAKRQVLSRWERATERLHHYSDADGLPAFRTPWAFAEDRTGAIWIALREGGVVRYKDGQFFRVAQAEGIRANGTFVYVDTRGRVWLPGAEGVLRVENPSAPTVGELQYQAVPNLTSLRVNVVTEDQWGRIYFGTSQGLDRLDPNTDRIWHYTIDDGLPANEITHALRDRDGVLWFSGRAGISRFVPGMDRPAQVPPVTINAAHAANRTASLGVFGDAFVDLQAMPGPGLVQVDFSSSSFGAGGPVRYQYRLEGAEHDWSAPGWQRSVRYAGLAPGRYRLLVRAISPQGMVSEEPASVTFSVLPPFWQRWWFIAIAASSVLLLAYVAHRYRVGQLLALERIRTRIATDLHDEIGANLSQIAVLSEVARRRVGEADRTVSEPLAHMADVSRESVAAMSEIVWAVDPHRDAVTELEQRMRRFANDVLATRDVVVHFPAHDTTRGLKVAADVRRDVFLVFKEAINNVGRHAAATTVDVDFRVRHHALTLTVVDDGNGVDVTATNGVGLRSMRARAERLGGRLRVESTNGHGTRVSLTVPLRHRNAFHWLRNRRAGTS